MATGFDHLMNTTPLPAIGKGRVGAPSPPPAGQVGVTIRVAIFFDGTKNNRSNTTKRLNDRRILQVEGHDAGSSYGNYYSNPAIHEFMNNRNNPFKHEVSHYVEGIGTRNFEEGATVKELVEVAVKGPDGKLRTQKHEVDKKDKNGRPILVQDEDNGLDDMYGNGFGSGPTGIREKVDSGIKQLRIKIRAAYTPKREYIEKIVFDVFGFSRGAAAARHFVHRHKELWGPWLGQGAGQKQSQLVINFVGLYDTVSSFAKGVEGKSSLFGNAAYDAGLNTDKLFCDDVKELGLNLGGVPKKVVHLTAGDEHRQNFSLTNINSSLAAGVGFELTLPGVHSDVGGSYVEAGQGALNVEKRIILSEAERRRLVAEGWYTDGRPGPDGKPTPNQLVPIKPDHWVNKHEYSAFGYTIHTPASGRDPAPTWYGVRSLTTSYQFITLNIMHEFATCGGKHEALDFARFTTSDFAAYQIPPPLASLGRYFLERAQALDGARTRQVLACPSPELTKWLRNHYLHRSAKQSGDGGFADTLGMESRADFIKDHISTARLIIPDDNPDFIPPSQAGAAERASGYHPQAW